MPADCDPDSAEWISHLDSVLAVPKRTSQHRGDPNQADGEGAPRLKGLSSSRPIALPWASRFSDDHYQSEQSAVDDPGRLDAEHETQRGEKEESVPNESKVEPCHEEGSERQIDMHGGQDISRHRQGGGEQGARQRIDPTGAEFDARHVNRQAENQPSQHVRGSDEEVVTERQQEECTECLPVVRIAGDRRHYTARHDEGVRLVPLRHRGHVVTERVRLVDRHEANLREHGKAHHEPG